METLKKRLPWLTERNLLILLTFLVTAFCAYFLVRPSEAVLSAFLMPWAIGMTYVSLRKRKIARNAARTWACLSIAALIFSGILTYEISARWGYGVWLIVFCTLFLLSPPCNMSRRAQHAELLSVGTLLITLFMPFAILAVISVFVGHPFRLPCLTRPVGLIQDNDASYRVLIFSHPNITAHFAVFNILFAIYAICRLRKGAAVVYFSLNILLNAMVLVHTQSRTCMIALAFGMALILFRCIFLCFSRRFWRIFAAILAAAAAFWLMLTLLNGLYAADIRLARALSIADLPAASTQSRAASKGQFDVLGNGRDAIWRSSIRYLLDNPRYLIHGMGTEDMIGRIAESYPNMAKFTHLHSTFLECLARYGIPYLICVLGFLCAMVIPSLKVLLAPASREDRGTFIIPVMIAVALVMSLPERMLFISDDWVNLLFYFICGHVLHAARLIDTKKNTSEDTL